MSPSRNPKKVLLIPSAILAMFASIGIHAADDAGTPAGATPPPVATPAPEAAPAKDWSVGLSTDLVSKYVWRGMLQNGDPAVQPSVTLGWKGLSLNVWQSWDTTNYGTKHYPGGANRQGRVEECDYTLGYSRTVLDGKLTLGGGVICYTFPDTYPTTTELYASATVNTFLSPTIAVYRDIDESKGLYITPSISHTITINDKTNVVFKANVGWGDANNNDYYFAGMAKSKDALADYGLSATINYSVTPEFVVSPYVKFSDFIDGDIRDQRKAGGSYDGKSEQVVVGVTAAYTF